jgi:hypothetical protein
MLLQDAVMMFGHATLNRPKGQAIIFSLIFLKPYRGGGWDMLIAFPDCTYLTASGLHWNGRVEGRADKTEQALEFVRRLMDADIPQIAIENPVGCISSRIRKPDQSIQPYEFGEDASKRTCLWLKNLPILKPPRGMRVPGRLSEWPAGSGRMVERWANQTDSGQNALSPSDKRAEERSRTYWGIALQMAEQWG